VYVSLDRNNVVVAVSTSRFSVDGAESFRVLDGAVANKVIGKRLRKFEDTSVKPTSELRVAIVCNWQTKCGISTYSKYLVDALRPLVKEIRIFSEVASFRTDVDGPEVERCWKRGECLVPMTKKVLEWKPDFVIIQHEYGIFPNAFYFMQMMQQFENTPYAVTLHSIYEHLDKLVYSSCIKNMVVHSEPGKEILRRMGNTNNISVIPHGCVFYEDTSELWNICLNPYTILQFGFGFAYKGVERGLEAIAHLKARDDKFRRIFYIVLISENDYNSRHHLEYYHRLCDKIKELDLEENVALVRKFHSEQMLCLYLRLAKLAIFPYINNPNNTVFGASGAIRLAVANRIPVIASESHLFDDFEGVVPRPDNPISLADEIDRVFSNELYKRRIIDGCEGYQHRTSWSNVAQQYLDLYSKTVLLEK
jgi:glycosyltransferase involved in cell wall biosynthesis